MSRPRTAFGLGFVRIVFVLQAECAVDETPVIGRLLASLASRASIELAPPAVDVALTPNENGRS